MLERYACSLQNVNCEVILNLCIGRGGGGYFPHVLLRTVIHQVIHNHPHVNMARAYSMCILRLVQCIERISRSS